MFSPRAAPTPADEKHWRETIFMQLLPGFRACTGKPDSNSSRIGNSTIFKDRTQLRNAERSRQRPFILLPDRRLLLIHDDYIVALFFNDDFSSLVFWRFFKGDSIPRFGERLVLPSSSSPCDGTI